MSESRLARTIAPQPLDQALCILRVGAGALIVLLTEWHAFAGAPVVALWPLSSGVRLTLSIGGVLLALGIRTRLVAAAMAAVTLVGLVAGFAEGQSALIEPARNWLFLVVFATLALTGAGGLSVDAVVASRDTTGGAPQAEAPRRGPRARIDVALLVLRVGAGASLAVLYGVPKLIGAIAAFRTRDGWAFAEFMRQIGFPAPVLLAACATFNETVCAACVALGVVPRLTAASLAADMLVSFGTSMRLAEEPLRAALYALIFAAVAIVGPGRITVPRLRAPPESTSRVAGSPTRHSRSSTRHPT